MTRITIPFLDANIPDVTVVKWHKSPGDAVSEGEVVVEVSSDKAAYEIESPASGTLLAVFAPEKSIVPVKTILALVGAEGETDDGIAAENARILSEYRATVMGARPSTLPRDVPIARVPQSAASCAAPLRATPKARRLAAASGIDLADVAKATGASMVTEAMVQSFIDGRGK